MKIRKLIPANRSPMVPSLYAFQQRVLQEGYVPHFKSRDYSKTKHYTLEELKNKLFFNQIFISNTTEMFQRHDMSIPETKMAFMRDCQKSTDNIDMIVREAENITGIKLSRIAVDMDTSLSIGKAIGAGSVSLSFHPSKYKSWEELERVDPAYRIIDGQIYYLNFDHDTVHWNVLPSNHPVYSMRFINDNKTMYKTDYAISWWFTQITNSERPCIVRFTLNKHREITKVEAFGSPDAIKAIRPILPASKALFIPNKYLFTDDIMDMITMNMTEKKQEVQTTHHVNVLDYLKHDDLIEYPVDSFEEYISFLQSVVDCPDTEAISLCLYRIGSDPRIFNILKQAAYKGIELHVNIELYASGETINKFWLYNISSLPNTHVTTYGGKSIKVHCKLTLVRFINGKAIAQIGTGNYHTKTTTQYTDLSLITSDPSICYQVLSVFQILKEKFKYDPKVVFNSNLLVTRYNAREQLVKLILNQADSDGYICMKCNAIDDTEIIDALNTAAKSGCTIDLIVRGVITWIPDEDSSVTIKSIVWDKLEHSRVFCFGHTDPKIYMGSLDLVTHKLDDRIETLVKITDPDIMLQISQYLNRYITTSNGYILYK